MSVSKNCIKRLFDELLRWKRGFKYIINVKITLKKQINDNEFEHKTLYFESPTKNGNKSKIFFKWLIWRNTKSIRDVD